MVASAKLQAAAVFAIEVQEVVTLKQLIGELGERHAMVGISGKAFLHRILCHHIVDSDVLADVANEVEESIALHPIVVVHQHSRIGGIAVEIKKLGKLSLDALLIVAQGVLVDEHTFLALHRRVANHARGAADKGDWAVARTLQVAKHHHAHQVTDM